MNTAKYTQVRLGMHGAIILFLGLLAGIGFSYAAALNLEDAYGNWRFAHLEGITNGLMVLAIAAIWSHLEETRKTVIIAKWTLLIGAYCNIIGPWITALFIGHRVIEPHTPLESFVVYGFYIPGTLPMISFPLFIWELYRQSKS